MTVMPETSWSHTIVLLNSSHARFPMGRDNWVRATLNALDNLSPGACSLITSIALPGWELTAWAAGRAGFSQTLVLPGEDDGAGRRFLERCLADLALESRRTTSCFTGRCGAREFLARRDKRVFELARTVLPVSVRPRGRLDSLLEQFGHSGGEIDRRFQVDYCTGGWKPSYNLELAELNPCLREFDSGWLFHWTHSQPGPWPGEPVSSFYSDMTKYPDCYVRSADATLLRIAREGVIRGSSFHKAGGTMMVSLTGLTPGQTLPLMRWRSRYRRWSIEPFGIAIRRRALLSLGARRVRYYDTIPRDLPLRDRPFSQVRGKMTDWRGEEEWRVRGDVHLDRLDPSDVVLLAYDMGELARRRETTHTFEVLPLLA